MNQQEYNIFIDREIKKTLKDSLLANYKNQIFAWRLNADFKKNYKLDYLWNRAVFLSSNCAYLLMQGGDIKIITSGLKTSAEIFEYLSELEEITDMYDKDAVLLLSALCYDLSGYQANAYCIARQIGDYTFESENPNKETATDTYIVRQITNILLKKLPAMEMLIEKSDNLGINLFNQALRKWLRCIFKLSNKSNYTEAFERVYKYYLNSHNVYISHLLALLNARIAVFDQKSVWITLKKNKSISKDPMWHKYIKLLAYDYYSDDSIKAVNARISIFELWTSQLRAVQEGLLERDENFVLQMPTSAGKTFIAELSILKHLTEFPNKKCIYIAPFRALTSEKEIEMSKYFSKLGYSVSALSGSYEVDSFQDVIISQTDLLIATPEKIDLLFRVNPEIFDDISLIVVDEGHIIGEISTRASLLEFLIIRLKIKLPELKMLFISAVMPPKNADEYALWLSGHKENVIRSLQYHDSPVTEEWEPTRKLIGSFTWTNNGSQIGFINFEENETVAAIGSSFVPNYLMLEELGGYPSTKAKPVTTAALAYKMSFEGNTLVFCAQPRFTKTIAQPLLKIIEEMDLVLPRWFIADENKESYFYAKMWYGEDDYITQSVKHGVGIHFGDMPEQVRNSVEHDYRSGKLRVLLSSNTVGQGLNFPIKNLIFYNLAIGQDGWKQIFISNRDFWNIVGRAGRAGKETEGKILFVISTPNDQKIYENFTNRSNLEEADSLFSKVFKAYNNGPVSGRQRDRQLAILSETYLMEMFAEEIVGTDFEEIINKIINNSLFKIQIDEDDIEIIKNSFRRTFAKFENELNIEDAAVYKLSGFSYDSNLVIDEFIVGNLEVLNELIISDDYLGYLKLVWQFLLDSDIEELKDPKLNNIGLSTDVHFTVMELWISGTPLEVIITQWKKTHTIEQFHLFLSKGLYYLYPWALTAFMNTLSYRLEIDADELPYNISNLPSYLKYGLPDTAGCLARSLGIKNRDAVNQLIPLAKDKDGADFIKWLSNLSLIKIRDLDLSTFDEENIINVCRRLTPNRFNKLPEVLTFTIEGTEDYTSWSRRSLLVVEGSRIKYRRLRNRSKDPYAIYLYYGMRIIGRVPSQYSKILSSEIDINGTDYVIKAVKVVKQIQHTIITVEMTIDDLL